MPTTDRKSCVAGLGGGGCNIVILVGPRQRGGPMGREKQRVPVRMPSAISKDLLLP
jgi:hypothetical protein